MARHDYPVVSRKSTDEWYDLIWTGDSPHLVMASLIIRHQYGCSTCYERRGLTTWFSLSNNKHGQIEKSNITLHRNRKEKNAKKKKKKKERNRNIHCRTRRWLLAIGYPGIALYLHFLLDYRNCVSLLPRLEISFFSRVEPVARQTFF